MWVCMNRAFLSIVEPSAEDRVRYGGDVLLVRARRKGDIEAVFGKATAVDKRPERDYLFRAFLPRDTVAQALAAEVTAIDYPNFKNSVVNRTLHDAYAAIWHVMAKLQPSRPYSGFSASRGRLL